MLVLNRLGGLKTTKSSLKSCKINHDSLDKFRINLGIITLFTYLITTVFSLNLLMVYEYGYDCLIDLGKLLIISNHLVMTLFELFHLQKIVMKSP